MIGRPQFAMVGRSNVGKSSLINAVLNRKAVARVSQTPGKTQAIQFYLINEQFLHRRPARLRLRESAEGHGPLVG